MKTFLEVPLVCLFAVIAFSCEKFSITRYYRSQIIDGQRHGSPDDPPGPPSPDTIVYVSAVVMPENYDWKRDTAFGAVKGEVMLLENGIPLFTLPTGPQAEIDTDPLTHHLIDGHLYTEYAGTNETVIRKDGELLLRYPVAEVLKGLIIREDGIYTLGREVDGNGFSYRRNGELLLHQSEGVIFGDFQDPSCGPSGALVSDYEDYICFAFKTPANCYRSVDAQLYQVKMTVAPARVKDMVVHMLGAYFVADYTSAMMATTPSRHMPFPTMYKWNDVKVFFEDDTMWYIGENSIGNTVCGPIERPSGSNPDVEFVGCNNYLFRGSGGMFAVSGNNGTLMVQKEGQGIIYERDSTYVFGKNCAASLGNSLYVLVNPKEDACKPYVWHDGEKMALNVNGYLTGISLDVSLPN